MKYVVIPVIVLAAIIGMARSNDPFNPAVQQWVFYAVGQKLPYAKFIAKPPKVIRAEDLSDRQFADAIGTDVFGSKRGNFYSWKLDAVLLAEDFADIDSLAHEFVHYYQWHRFCENGGGYFNQNLAEQEAVRIQNDFR